MKIFLLCLLAFTPQSAYVQDLCTVYGNINSIIDGKIFMFPAVEQKEYYGDGFYASDSSQIKNGKFTFKFKLRVNSIYPFRFLVRTDTTEYLTGEVYLEPGSHIIKIESLNEFIAPVVVNSDVQRQYAELYLGLFKRHIQESEYLDSLYSAELESTAKMSSEDNYLWRNRYDSLSIAGDEILREFIEAHPFSPIASWKLIQRFEANGYRSIYAECFSKLSVLFRQSANGIELEKRLRSADNLSVGRIFPKMSALDLSGKEVLIDSIYFSSHKYTLVDFWFHNCGPCIRQFGELKEVYDSYKQDGFEVLSISVDKKEDFQLWQSRSHSLGLIWRNIIDLDGKESSSYLVNSFPTSFLVDRNGRIIRKNIDVFELVMLLNHIKGN